MTQEELKKALRYDPETGLFVWLRSFRGKKKADAGYIDLYGYRNIRCHGPLYKAHRLAWLYIYGEWPSGEIDHINGVPGDNRIANLRIATRSQQNANNKLRCNNTTGFKGVSRVNGRFGAYVRINKKSTYLGTFDTAEEAHKAYVDAAREAYGLYARAS